MTTRTDQRSSRVKFGDVVRLVRSRSNDPARDGLHRYVGLEHIDPGNLKISRWGQVESGTTFTTVFRAGQVLFAKRRAYQVKVAVADFDGVCSSDIYVLEAQDKRLLAPLLPFLCQSGAFIQYAVGTSAGTMSPRTNWRNLASYEFEIPSDSEQRRGANALHAAAAVVASLRSAEAATYRLYDRVATNIFAEVVHPDGERFDQYVTEAGDRAEMGLPILSVTIDGEVVRRSSLGRLVSDNSGEGKYLTVRKGELVYNTMRLWQGSVGIAAEDGLVSPAYTVLRVNDPAVPSWFVRELLRSHPAKSVLRRFVRGVASDRWRIYFRDLSAMEVRLPRGEELLRITEVLKATARARAAATSRASGADELLRVLRTKVLGS